MCIRDSLYSDTEVLHFAAGVEVYDLLEFGQPSNNELLVVEGEGGLGIGSCVDADLEHICTPVVSRYICGYKVPGGSQIMNLIYTEPPPNSETVFVTITSSP